MANTLALPVVVLVSCGDTLAPALDPDCAAQVTTARAEAASSCERQLAACDEVLVLAGEAVSECVDALGLAPIAAGRRAQVQLVSGGLKDLDGSRAERVAEDDGQLTRLRRERHRPPPRRGAGRGGGR